MSATANSGSQGLRRLTVCVWVLAVLCGERGLFLACGSEAHDYFSLEYTNSFRAYDKPPASYETAWRFGRACFDLAEFATNNTERALLAQQGIDACRRAVSLISNAAPAHYYLGMNFGQLARTRGIGALKLVKDMEHEFSLARRFEEKLDFGGPDRNLGLLYRDTPAVISIGSRGKARHHLRRALELAPDYPENKINLIEAYLKWGEKQTAARELAQLESALPSARARFSNGAWKFAWADWDARLAHLREKVPPKQP